MLHALGTLKTDEGKVLNFSFSPALGLITIFFEEHSDHGLGDPEAKAILDLVKCLIDESNKFRHDGRQVEITTTCDPNKVSK